MIDQADEDMPNFRDDSDDIDGNDVQCTASEKPVNPSFSKHAEHYGKSKMWATAGVDFFPCESTVTTLPPGQYLIRISSQRGLYFSKKTVNLDSLIEFPDDSTEQVLKSINKFWKREKFFRQYGFLWKRGVLLWGPPGSGKTSTVQRLSKQIVEAGGITVYCTNPELDAAGLRVLRQIEPDRPIVVILEDIDAIIRHHGEADLLALLDGELQIDNVVFVATTNYPELLDKRIVNRPSRFDEVVHIGMPNEECRTMFLKAKNPRLVDKPEELRKWIDATDKFSIAHIKELIISVECLGNTFDKSLKRLKDMMQEPTSSDSYGKGKVGFLNK